MKAKTSWLLVTLLIVLCIVSASCSSSNDVAEGPQMTPEEEEQMAQRGVVNVETVEDACRIAGFPVATPTYIPEGFAGGSFSVSQLGAGLPEEMRPKFTQINVQRIWSREGEPEVLFVLIQSQHKSSIGGGEPAEICGRQGERKFSGAEANRPAKLSLGWEDNGYYFSLSGVLGGSLDETTLEKIACSIKVE
jgi:hypothetical protein